ncbi:MAG: hypothetical protein K2O45_03155 [Oscillospiraceae bacterium]|nr:hypothetical protein [Oscillospiraceae bacterium]
MKKYVTKLFSLLMAVCMVGSLLAPSALAAVGAESPRAVVVPNGMRIGVQYVVVYPAYYIESTGKYIVDYNINKIHNYPAANQQNGSCRLSTAETTNLLNQFKEKFDMDANVWVFASRYSLYADGKGSYGKYFQFTTSGDCIEGKSIRVDVGRNDSDRPVGATFRIPENTTGTYSIGLYGGFYYYSAYAKKELSSMAQVDVYFNSTF